MQKLANDVGPLLFAIGGRMLNKRSCMQGLAAVVALVVATMPASAYQDGPQTTDQSTTPPPIVVTGKKKVDPNKQLCRRETPTGSLMAKLTCRTNSEWAAVNQRSIAEMDRAKRDRTVRDMIQIDAGKK